MNKDALAKSRVFEKANATKIERAIPNSLKREETRIASKIRNSNKSPIEKLVFLYQFMDSIYSCMAKYIPCHAGCDHCCHYNVTISQIEIAYIEQQSKIAHAPFLRIKSNHHDGSPCPFLKNSQCEIYKCRPFVCRRFASLAATSDWCRIEICNQGNHVLFRFSKIDEAYECIVGQLSLATLVDIREAFPFGMLPVNYRC